MKPVDLTKWGGTKVRQNLQKIWPLINSPFAVQANADFITYQQSLATTIDNVNQLIASHKQMRAELDRRPF